MVKRGLGRGLSALIPSASAYSTEIAEPRPVAETVQTAPEPTASLPTEQISPNPYQPRTRIDEAELEDLAQSIRTQGLLQPIIVRPFGDRYQLVAGERRWQAAKKAGLDRIPVVIRECTDREMLELAIVENLQRADINALDSARAYKRLNDEFAMTQGEVAERVGKSRSAVANTVRLLELPIDVQHLLSEGKLSEGHARAILMCELPAAMRALARKVVAQSLSVRQTEKLAQGATTKRSRRVAAPGADAILAEVVARLRRRLGTNLRIQRRAKGGAIEIDFYDDEQLTRLVDLLLGAPQGGGKKNRAVFCKSPCVAIGSVLYSMCTQTVVATGLKSGGS